MDRREEKKKNLFLDAFIVMPVQQPRWTSNELSKTRHCWETRRNATRNEKRRWFSCARLKTSDKLLWLLRIMQIHLRSQDYHAIKWSLIGLRCLGEIFAKNQTLHLSTWWSFFDIICREERKRENSLDSAHFVSCSRNSNIVFIFGLSWKVRVWFLSQTVNQRLDIWDAIDRRDGPHCGLPHFPSRCVFNVVPHGLLRQVNFHQRFHMQRIRTRAASCRRIRGVPLSAFFNSGLQREREQSTCYGNDLRSSQYIGVRQSNVPERGIDSMDSCSWQLLWIRLSLRNVDDFKNKKSVPQSNILTARLVSLADAWRIDSSLAKTLDFLVLPFRTIQKKKKESIRWSRSSLFFLGLSISNERERRETDFVYTCASMWMLNRHRYDVWMKSETRMVDEDDWFCEMMNSWHQQ